MHEMGIALEIIDITIASIPPDSKNSKVKKINVHIGKLSAIAPNSLKFCFDIASKNTILSEAKLSLKIVPVTIKCQQCKTKFTINEPIFKCKNCNSGTLDLLSGKELDIHSIEIENEE